MEINIEWNLIFIPLVLGFLIALFEVAIVVWRDERKRRSIKRFVGRIIFFKEGFKIYSSSSSSAVPDDREE